MSSANFELKSTAAASRGFLATARFSCYISPGILPGAAAPLTFLSIKKCDNEVPVLAANGFSGLVVHEEIHLFGSDLFKLIF